MAHAEFTVAHQKGHLGCYAKVLLDVDLTSGVSSKFHVEFDSDHLLVPKLTWDWQLALRFGLEYGWEQYLRSRPGKPGAQVRVLGVHIHNDLDTRPIIVAFAAANALWRALGFAPPPGTRLDPENLVFSLPR